MSRVDFYNRIKSLCKQERISIHRLEDELGLGINTIVSWKGRTSPTFENVVKVADYFGVSLDWLVYGRIVSKAAARRSVVSSLV